MNKKNNKITIRDNIIWNSIGNIIYLTVQWLLSYFVVKLMGVENAGVYSLAMSIGNMFVSVSYYSIRNFQVSDVNKKYRNEEYIASRGITSMVAIVSFCVFVVINQYDVKVAVCLFAFMLFKLTEAWSDVYQGIVQSNGRMDYIGKSFIIKSIVILTLFLVIAITTDYLFFCIFGMLMGSFAIVLVYDRKCAMQYCVGGEHVRLYSVKDMLVECMPLALYSIVFTSLPSIPRYFMELELGTFCLGIYSSIAIPVVIIQAGANFILAPLITPFANSIADCDIVSIKSISKKVCFFLVALFAFSVIGFGCFGEIAICIAFGKEIAAYSFLLMPIVICTLLIVIGTILSMLLTILRKLRILLLSSLVALAIVLFGCNPFMRIWGMNGASYILIVAFLAFNIIAFIAVLIFLREHISRFGV